MAARAGQYVKGGVDDGCGPSPVLISRVISSITPPNAPSPLGESVSRETLHRLRAYVELLSRWNKTVNLMARNEETNIWDRHIGDSLRLRELIPTDAISAVDLGSGAGLPGLVLAIATGLPFTLVEADHRKAAFLHEAVRITHASAGVLCCRIEALPLEQYPVIVARGLAPLSRLLAYAHRLLAPGGVGIFPKGQGVEAEIRDARREWRFVATRHVGTREGSCVLRISDIVHV